MRAPALTLLAFFASLLLVRDPAQAQVFTPVSSPAIAAYTGFPLGVTWVDFDEDGDLDLYLVTGFDAQLDNVLYRNDSGSFVAVVGSPLVADHADTPCSAWADVDNDGHLDVFVSNLGAANGALYRGQGGGAYAAAAGALPAILKGAGCAFGDYDNDGFVDLIVAAIYGQLGMATPSRLFHNDGDGTFTEVTTGPIASTTDSHHHPTWSDFDGDGDLDLFFGTGPVGSTDVDRMYRNRLAETGTADFVPIATGIIATEARDSQVLQWVDYDNDGDLDLFAVNYTSVPCQLYRNDGGGAWTKIVAGSLVTDVGSAHSAAWGDFDNDGDLDVYVATDLGQSNRYYRNDGGGAFTRVFAGAFVSEGRSNYGVASGDYDADGDLDLFVPTARAEGPSLLFRNDTANGHHWLEIVLAGVTSNRSGIGAKVRVRAVIGGQPHWQLRELRTGTGYGGQDALAAHFGLGDAGQADSVVVEWPSGLRQIIENVAADRTLGILEGATTEVGEHGASPAPRFSIAVMRLTRSTVRVRLDLPTRGDTVLETFDLTGRRRALLRQTFEAGTHEISIGAPFALEPGVFFVRVTHPAGSRCARGVAIP